MVDILIVDMMDVLPQIGVRTIICGKLRAKTRDLRIDGAAYVLSLSVSLSLSPIVSNFQLLPNPYYLYFFCLTGIINHCTK